MAYTHKVKKYIKERDTEGNIFSVFVELESSDGTSTLIQQVNLNQEERELLNTDIIQNILIKHIASIEEGLDEMTKNTPFPPIIATAEECASISTFSRTKINSAKNRQAQEKEDNPNTTVIVDASLPIT